MQVEKQKKVIGVTGGVGSGKSRILLLLEEEYHALVIRADDVAKELEEPGMPGYQAIVKALGSGILNSESRIDREKLSRWMFQNESVLKTVNELIHPMTWQAVKERIQASNQSLTVVEAALFRKNQDDIYDELWYVYTSRHNRIKRLKQSRNYSEEKSKQIMKSQPAEEEFRSICTHVIDNNGSFEDTKRQVGILLGILRESERV